MRGVPLIILSSFLLFTTSCSKTEANSQLDFSKQEIQVIFFTDESQYQNEAPYYDAIIKLKKDYPEVFKNMLIFSPKKAEDYYQTFKVREFPTILILHKEQIIVRVHGEYSKEEIIQPISDALSAEL